MEIEDYKHIKINNPKIVEILTEYKGFKELHRSCERVLLEFLTTAADLMRRHADIEDTKRRETSLMHMIKSIEDRQQEYSKQLEHNLKTSLTSTVTESLSTILQSHNNMLALTIESFGNRFNANNISSTITETLRTWLDNQLSLHTTNIQLMQHKLKDDFQRLTTPLSSAQDEVLNELRQLPAKIEYKMNLDVDIQRLTTTVCTFQDQMHQIRSEMKDIESVVKVAMAKVSESKDLNISQHKTVNQAISSIPLLTKGVLSDMIRSLEDKNARISIALSEISEISKDKMKNLEESIKNSTDSMTKLTAHTQNISYKVDEVDKRLLTRHVKEDNSNQIKGASGEGKVIDMLSDRLLARDGYRIQQVSGISHSCDILVQKMNHPDIRVEVKAHNDKVRYKEVEKFKNDLQILNNHGIFVSLHNGIVGVSDFEIEHQSTGKFAIYLANNNYDMDIIVSMILLLYRLDVITHQDEENQEGIRVSHDTLKQIKETMKDHMAKIHAVKSHLKESMTILGNIQLDFVEKLLLNEKEQTRKKWGCKWCSKSYDKVTSLRSHENLCPNRP